MRKYDLAVLRRAVYYNARSVDIPYLAHLLLSDGYTVNEIGKILSKSHQ